MSTQNIHILIYDTQISSVYKTIDHLKRNFSNLVIVKNEDEFHEVIEQQLFDIILINLDVSPHDGIAITKELRANTTDHHFFIVIYTNKQDDFLYELAYNNGADAFVNYHNTPVLMELLLKSLAKRLFKSNQNIIKNNEFRVDEERFLVVKNNIEKELPKKEFKLLLLLYKHPDKFFTKKELAASIWNDELVAAKRTIDVHIYNIRQIFGKKIIQSQKGKGYRINRKFI